MRFVTKRGSFIFIEHNLLGKHTADKYAVLVNDIVTDYELIGL